MCTTTRRAVLRLLPAALLGHASRIHAQRFPSKPIHIVVPFGPGGVNDIVTRMLAEGLTRKIGSPVIVENKPGAGSVLGAGYVARAAPDGYTLLLGANTSMTINPNLQRNLPYEPAKDFVVVAAMYQVPIVLMAKPDFPANSLDDFVALARREAGRLAYGSFGQGSSSHLVMEWLKALAGIDLVHVPYAGGAAATQALLGGQVAVALDALTGALPQVRAGRLKVLSLMQNAPSAIAPTLPSTGRSAFGEIDVGGWTAVFAPAATPADRLAFLRAHIAAVVQDPAFIQRLSEMGVDVDRTTPVEIGSRMAAESARMARIIRDANITEQ